MFSIRNMGRLSAAATLLAGFALTATANAAFAQGLTQPVSRQENIQVISKHPRVSPAETTIDKNGLLPNGIVANIGSYG